MLLQNTYSFIKISLQGLPRCMWIAIERLTQKSQCGEEAEQRLEKYCKAQRSNEYLIIYKKWISSIRQAEGRLALQPQPSITQFVYNRLS